METGVAVSIAVSVLMAAFVWAIMIVWLVVARQRHGKGTSAAGAGDTVASKVEMQAIEPAGSECRRVNRQMEDKMLESDEETEAGDLAIGTCRLCGSTCGPAGCSDDGEYSDVKLRQCPVRGEIVVSATDVGIRSTSVAPEALTSLSSSSPLLLFLGGAGGAIVERVQPMAAGSGSRFASVAALPGREYQVWHCRTERHPAEGPAGRSAAGHLCPHCRPIIGFRLQPGELLFNQTPPATEAAEGSENVWVVARVEDAVPASSADKAGAQRQSSVAYRGYLSDLKRLPFFASNAPGGTLANGATAAGVASARAPSNSGKLTIQFGVSGRGTMATAALGEEATTEEMYSEPAVDLARGNFREDEFKVAMRPGLLAPQAQISASIECFKSGDDTGDLSDCEDSSSTMSAQTGQSGVNRRMGSSSAKWAAIGMQEVANIIESSSSDEPQQHQQPQLQPKQLHQTEQQQQNQQWQELSLLPEAAATVEASRLQTQNSAAASLMSNVATTAANATAVAAIASTAAEDAEYLWFMYSDASSSCGGAGADAVEDVEAEAGSGNEGAAPSKSTDFYSADSNGTSCEQIPAGLAADIGSSGCESDLN